MKHGKLRTGILSLLVAFVVSCGGGGGGGGGFGMANGTAPLASGAVAAGGAGVAAVGSPGDASGGLGGIAADDGSGTSTAGSNATATAGSIGTTTASGDDGSGVGSGGTGVSTADATGVGAVDGAGSIIVNGLRYDTSTTVGTVEDASGLQLGMTVKVTGPVNGDFTSGIARRVESAADIRGPLQSVNLGQGSFVVLGTTVTTDEATVWADAPGLAAIPTGKTVQVWGLPGAPGVLRATRVEQREAAAFILTGTVQNLDAAARTFVLGGLVVDYGHAALAGNTTGQPLADGILVRVRADATSAGHLVAALVEWWYPVPMTDGTTVQLAGIVTNYAGPASLRVLGLPVDASRANITGGPAGSLGNGVKVEVGGRLVHGMLQATKLKIRHVPGTGGPVSFDLIGTVGSYRSAADFRVRGQPVDASGPGVVFGNGSVSNLGNGVKVHVHGEAVTNGVLKATRVDFE